MAKKNKGNELIKKTAPQGQGKEIGIRRTLVAEQRFSGPIPPAEEFKKYGDVLPDAPERLFAVFEAESKSAREDRNFALKANVRKDSRAQWMSFIIMLAAMGMTTVAIVFGKNITPGIVTGLATLFLALRVLFPGRKRKNDSEET